MLNDGHPSEHGHYLRRVEIRQVKHLREGELEDAF